MLKKRLDVEPDRIGLIGAFNDDHLKILKDSFNLRIHARRGKLILHGEDGDVGLCERAIHTLMNNIDRGERLSDESVKAVSDFYLTTPQPDAEKQNGSNPDVPRPGRKERSLVMAKTGGQDEYLRAMHEKSVTFAAGPAGTGKTFLAVGTAVQYLLGGQVERIVLVRPAVEAGEKLGFLPGDLKEKIRPYLLPIYDALRVFLGPARLERYLSSEVIEIAPLAYMRGRTMESSFMILDEAQNTTPEQMKMFLTRLGTSSRAVVTGDPSQIDLGVGKISGMVHAMRVLRNVREIAFVELTPRDIVRHPIVVEIIKAYGEEQPPSENRTSSGEPVSM